MKKNQFKIGLSALLFIAFTLFGCSKKDINGPSLNGKSSITMNIDGKPWKSQISTLLSEDHSDYSKDPYYSIYLNGVTVVEKGSNGQDVTQSLALLLHIPVAKFNNPKGSYPINATEDELNNVWGFYLNNTSSENDSMYVPISGTLKIDSFKTGEIKILGQKTGEQGYTKLSGSFEMELKSFNGSGPNIKITNGKFDLDGAFNIGM